MAHVHYEIHTKNGFIITTDINGYALLIQKREPVVGSLPPQFKTSTVAWTKETEFGHASNVRHHFKFFEYTPFAHMVSYGLGMLQCIKFGGGNSLLTSKSVPRYGVIEIVDGVAKFWMNKNQTGIVYCQMYENWSTGVHVNWEYGTRIDVEAN